MAEGGNRVPVDPRHQAANPGIRADRFAGGAAGLDRGEIPHLVGLRRRSESAISRDHLLANVSLYWFTGAIGSSFWPYYARIHGQWPIPSGGTVDVPMGYAAFPKEIIRPPRSIARQMYTNIQRWTDMPRGGHFAAMEQPQALAAEIGAFFRPLR